MTNGPSEVAAGVREGQILAGKYRVDKVLGVGGMGIVVAARHIQLDERVALKFLLPGALANAEAVSRFVREARAAVKIKSEHVARVTDVGTLENGAPYMVMEFLDGGDLAAWLKQRGPLPLEQAVEFVLHACVAVAEAHSLGIVHRDLKPANLFCVRRPDGQLSVKVLDFGISKVTEAARSSEPPGMSFTKTSAMMGSPLYMSPEQMQSTKSVDSRSDIWALGVILYELLSGKVPFDGAALTEIAIKAATEPPPPIRGYRPDVPPPLEAVILRCLEKDRQRRYSNVAELAVALADFAPRRARASIERITNTIQAAGLSASALSMPPSPVVVVPGAEASSGTIAAVGQTAAPPTPFRRGPIVGGALLAVVVAAAAGLVLVRSAGPAASAASATGLVSPPVSAAPSEVPATSLAIAAASPEPEPAASPLPSAAVSVQPLLSAHPIVPAVAKSAALAPRPAHPPPATAPSCDPPYTLDDQGRKQFKPECYLKKSP